jgi:hypothetical protein
MAVHSICPGQYQTASSAGFVNFCLIAVGRFGSCFSISCNELSWDAVGSFLRLFSTRERPANTGG